MNRDNLVDDDTAAIIGCGHIGKMLAKRLQKSNITISAYVSSESSQEECQARHIPCEIIDLDKPLPTLLREPLDGALHALSGNSQHVIYLAPPPRTGKVDTRITNFLRVIGNHPPAKFVLISTTGVYGDCKGEWIDESRALKPNADRAFRRADAEQQTQQYCQLNNVPLVILRVPGIYGPGRVPLERIKSGQPIVNKQDSPFTNRIHADDLVTVCEKALLQPGITGLFNVTDGHPGTMYDYFTGVASALNLPAPPAISLQDAKQQLSEGMLSYMAESRRIGNEKLLKQFAIKLRYPNLQAGLKHIS